jgi:hypothetical protein
LEAAFAFSKKAPLILLAGYQTQEAICRIGVTKLAGWLKEAQLPRHRDGHIQGAGCG